MSPKRRKIFQLTREGKSAIEICQILEITKQNLYTTLWQMRQAGAIVEKRKNPLTITPKQLEVLRLYMEKVPVPAIAQRLNMRPQTVLNHAANGFKRLGLTTPGVDRIAALRDILEPKEAPKPITMDDPFFN